MSLLVKTVPNVEILHAGIEYKLSTGPTTFTPEDLRDAVMAANEDSSIPSPRLKIGHVDPRFNDERIFDGSPAFGKATNLRLSENGMAVMADYVGVPAWLAEIMPYAYPSRSIEGYHNVESQMGKKWRFVLTACSLLGVTWPGITVLEDLPQYWGEEVPSDIVIDAEVLAAVAAKSRQRPGGDPVKSNASANLDDVRRAFYNEYVPENKEALWWWIQAVLTDPNELVVEDDESGQLYKLSFSSDASGNVSFGEADAVRIDYLPDDRESMKAAATYVAATLAIGRKVVASWASREDSRDKTTGGAMDPKEVRKALELPEDATDAQVHEALLAKAGLTVIDGGKEGGEPVKPVAPPVAVEPVAPAVGEEKPKGEDGEEAPAAVAATGLKLPPGTVLMDETTLAELRAGIGRTDALLKKNDEAERQSLVAAAVADGRIPPARKDHWFAYLQTDPEGGKAALASLQPGTIPVTERGHAVTAEMGETLQQEAEAVASWSENLFPEVRNMRNRDRAAAAGGAVPRQRIMADATYRRGA